MNESENSWEQARSKNHKRVRSFLYFFIPVIIITAVILNNNLAPYDDTGEETANQEKSSEPDTKLTVKPDTGRATVVLRDDKPGKNVDKKPEAVKVDKKAEAAPVDKKSETVTVDKDSKALVNVPSNTPVELVNVVCRVLDRKDLRIRFDLDLFFHDERDRREILIKREDLKVLVENVFIRKELVEINKEKLRTELIDEMNGTFERKVIIDIVYKNFQIEKADTP